MRRTLLGALLLTAPAFAQAPEALTAWQYYQEIQGVPEIDLVGVDLSVEALDGARSDLADLRLYDANGREIPYALRIWREIYESDAFEAQEINRGIRDGATEVTLDLGESPGTHNQVELNTAGDGFRRMVAVEGSNDGEEWLTLAQGSAIFRFSSQGRGVDERSVEYPPSDYRFVRVRVAPDREIETEPPQIETLTVRRLTRSPGREQTFGMNVEMREPGREQGRPASIFRLDLYGRIPLHGLNLQIAEAPFSRPYRLETDGEENERIPLASGTLLSKAEGGSDEVKIRFNEQYASRLRLIVTDDRNPELMIYGGSAISATRQVFFSGLGAAQPLRLYYGNPDAAAPHYDFDATVPNTPPDTILPVYLNGERLNPDYQPPQAPLTERAPWAIYAVLAAAALAILVLLRRVLGSINREG
jgi:hypothetical protein